VRLEDIDLSALEFWTAPIEQREAAFATLRAQDPLRHFVEPDFPPLPKGPGYYAVTRHADILEVSRQPEVYSSAGGVASALDTPVEFNEFFGSMINMDDPRHARLRSIVSAGFTPRMLRKLEADVQRAAGVIVDDVIGRAGDGECDFVREVAAELPLQVICDMMGIPQQDRRFVFDRSNVILGAGDPEYVPEGEDVVAAMLGAGAELSQLVQDLARHRVAHPSDDLTSALVGAEVEGERLTAAELGSFFILLVVAGNETTRNAISHAMVAFSEHPDQRKAWMEDFEGVAPTAVEEIVRWASPVIFMRRTVTTSTTLSGQPLVPGDKLLLFYASANRDEEVFAEPYRFDVLRQPNPHVGFGGPGPHFCLGAHLARREITVMLRELFARVPDIEVVGPPARLASSFINGIKHLPVAFAPPASPARTS